MTNRVQTLRSSITTNVPPPGTSLPGNLWVNFPDLSLGVIDTTKTAQKLLAVRFFSSLGTYVAGDVVVQAGVIYTALGPVAPGAFNATQWTKNASLADIPAPYVLPTASTTILGGVKVDGSTVLINASGVISSVGSIFIGPAPPPAPITGTLWWDSMGGQLYVYYDDGTSKQWVIAVNENLAANYLALAGGTMTGNLGITAAAPLIFLNKTVAGNPNSMLGQNNGSSRWALNLGEGTAESGSGAGSDFTLNSYDDTGTFNYNVMRAYRSNGSVLFPNLVTVNGNLVSNGTLTSNGTLNATNINASNNIQAAGSLIGNVNMFPAYSYSTTFYLTANANDRYLFWRNDYYFDWSNSSGTLTYVANNAAAMSIDYSGNLWIKTNLTVPGNATVSGTMTASYVTSNSTLTVSGNSNLQNVYAAGVVNAGNTMSAPDITLSNAYGVQYAALSGYWYAFLHNANVLYVYANGGQYGAITFTSGSDDRIKDVAGPSPYGLKEILATEPILFTYKGNHSKFLPPELPSDRDVEKVPHDTSLHVGVSAQKQEKIIPEMIDIDEGYIDGEKVDDLRGIVHNEWLIYALVNAVKELAARVEQLEAVVVP